jgi:NADPH:quinone reductase-like Zn-dependent oxidoreductase
MRIVEGNDLGFEGSGVITKIGSGVKDLAVGDCVFYLGHGCFSTSIIVPTSQCVRIPWNMAFDEAVTIPCVFTTAIHCLLDIGKLEKGNVF